MLPPQPPQQGNDLKLEGLSRDQIKKIQKSMKKPEFMGLLNEYMIEISDPKNKTQYDEYLKQMQKEGELPKHMKLVKLKPQFCFRTQIISSRNKKHEMKFFINMCSSDYIEKPSCQPAKDENGGVGYSWKVPNSLGKIRYDQDKHKNPCQVIDCAFHPDTFIFSNQNTAFQAMIISIALEGAQKQLGERKQNLSRDYIILKNVKCKGENGEPALLPIRYIEGKAYNRGEGPTQQERNTEGKETKLQKQLTKQKEEYEKTNKKDEKDKEKEVKEQEEEQDLGEGNEKKQLIQDLQKGIQAPKYTSIYTYITDYSQFIDGPTPKKSRSLPSTFTVQFKVPRMENIAQATTLEINQKKIILAVNQKYYIDLSFEDMKVKNYPLKHAEAKAKFDKKKKTLRVQIPVDVSAIPEQQLPQYKDENQDKEADSNENGQIVENQAWKSKVLQIPEQVQTEKFLSQQQAAQSKKQGKKLIQEIDEDDIIQQRRQDDNGQEQIQQKQHQTPEQTQFKPFSLSSYYPPSSPNSSLFQTPTLLPHIFKQNSTHVFLTFYMRNYTVQNTKIFFDPPNGQIMILWLEDKQNQIAHLQFDKAYLSKCKNIQLFKRVGFVAVVLEKREKGNEGVWGEGCFKNMVINGGRNSEYYWKIIEQKNQNQRIERQQLKLKLQQEENKQKQRQIQKQSPPSIAQSPPSIPQKSQTLDDIIPSQPRTAQASNKENVQGMQSQAFQKLPIQFIRFNAEFIETLN